MLVQKPINVVFSQTIGDWNDLLGSLILSAEVSDDCVSKFTSLVRARDNFSQPQPLVKSISGADDHQRVYRPVADNTIVTIAWLGLIGSEEVG